jgi:phosphoribosylanthranilate isomerase
MQVKICGITKLEQASAIADLGATALGFICVPGTPRYVERETIQAIVEQVPNSVDRVGVFLDAAIEEICQTVAIANLNVVQLHGTESIAFCDALRDVLPDVKLIKAFRIRAFEDLEQVQTYTHAVHHVLLDAYHPQKAGGTGHTIDWTMLKEFCPNCPWYLSGGLNPDNILDALTLITPDGIDLSSGLENAPGDKNLERVQQLFKTLEGVKSLH